MKHVVCAVFCLFVLTSVAEAQLAGTFHVFPQVADGRFGDGTSYRTHFVVSNVNAPGLASCTFRLYGVPSDRLSPLTFNLATGAVLRVATNDLDALATGYATLTCSQPVKAFALYRYLSSTGVTLGLATVFSSPAMTTAYYLATSTDRLALAVANDTDAAQQYDLVARDAGGAIVATGAIGVAARSNRAFFADEVLSAPGGLSGTVVYINSGASSAFNTIGLGFAGPIFTTLPPFSTVP